MSFVTTRARPAIVALKAYSSARSLTAPEEGAVFLDANEMPCEPLIGVSGYARYAPQQPSALMAALAALYGVTTDRIMTARGADEAIDVLVRAFCEQDRDNIIICPPTFPMYAQSARLQGAAVKTVPLDPAFVPDVKAILAAADQQTKMVFVCSPNNPTGTPVDEKAIKELCEGLKDRALVVVDEAYVEFSSRPSVAELTGRYGNLVVLRTLSKAYALAGVRCGALIAPAEIVALCLKVLPPYPLPVPAVDVVLRTLELANRERLAVRRAEVLAIRLWFEKEILSVPGVEKVFPSETNFILVRVQDAPEFLARARKGGFILRDQSHQPGLTGCVRISMGLREDMERLLVLLKTGEAPSAKKGREASVVRRTKETAISVKVVLDQPEPVRIDTGIGFYDHMLEQIARHGGFSLVLECVGDLHIDPHHTIEDCAIALGQALKQALGDKAGIGRYGFVLPMDESLAQVTLDLSGRYFFKFEGIFPESRVGEMPTDMVGHVFRSLAENMQATLHMSVTGENSHHMVEACFKAMGRVLRQAVHRQGDVLPSTKGVL